MMVERQVRLPSPHITEPSSDPPRVCDAGLLVRAVDGSWVGLMGKVRDTMVSLTVVITPSAVVANFVPALDIVSLPGLRVAAVEVDLQGGLRDPPLALRADDSPVASPLLHQAKRLAQGWRRFGGRVPCRSSLADGRKQVVQCTTAPWHKRSEAGRAGAARLTAEGSQGSGGSRGKVVSAQGVGSGRKARETGGRASPLRLPATPGRDSRPPVRQYPVSGSLQQHGSRRSSKPFTFAEYASRDPEVPYTIPVKLECFCCLNYLAGDSVRSKCLASSACKIVISVNLYFLVRHSTRDSCGFNS
ncbi:hypothetical protein NDU88_005069 [Pleurodeles waltl]|uniref:Uncharacterized protein n=1 Tax=Pleurodeles waltl TaxID=8319 RepID=A0AAV7WAH5_PLEWA|nr:hypothetical protein NDU88_005069 [Pleurodeles waltl]